MLHSRLHSRESSVAMDTLEPSYPQQLNTKPFRFDDHADFHLM